MNGLVRSTLAEERVVTVLRDNHSCMAGTRCRRRCRTWRWTRWWPGSWRAGTVVGAAEARAVACAQQRAGACGS